MTLTNLNKTPWPWFGGKSDAAPAVWAALGDPAHYVEPFAGSLAVLMRRPATANRTYYSETVNDFDGLLVNAWRSIQMSPDATAEAASWPVSEADLHARHLALLRWRAENQLEHLMGDPLFHDPVMAGWWMWGQSCWIGSGWCSGDGSWIVGDDGRITKRQGQEGVARQRPHVSDDGRGVNHPAVREEGVARKRPHVSDDGMGVNTAAVREEGVARQRPHIANDGQGVNHAGAREEGVGEYHPMTMPELTRWMQYLSARLRHVRILNGDWSRACTSGALKSLAVRMGDDHAGVFLDPPYAESAGRDSTLYACEDLQVAHAAREWAIKAGKDPKYRIVFAGFEGEHGSAFEDAGWTALEWYKIGFLKGGMANTSGDKDQTQQARERLWMSPHCLRPEVARQGALFGAP